MGFLVWLVLGIVLALAARFLVRSVHSYRAQPPISAGVIGALLGGFMVDLSIRGDSVVNLKGPSTIGAAVGAAVVLAAAWAIRWLIATRRSASSRSR